MKFKDKENKKNNDNKEGNLTYRNATIANTAESTSECNITKYF